MSSTATPLRAPQMSPMHPPKPVETVEEETTSWVGRRVDALFSPVLNLFGGTHGANEHEEEEEHVVTDEDVAMMTEVPHEEDDEEHQQQEDVEQPRVVSPPSSSTSTATATAPPSMTPTAQDQPEQIVVTKSTEDEGELEEDPSSDDDEDDFNPYLFIKSLPRYESVRHLRPSIALPPKHPNAPPVTLVLDLDETLVHCTVEACTDADLTFPVVFHGVSYQVHVRLRPFLFEFLEAIHDKFEVVVFTASQRVYADELLDRIDPSKCLLVFVMLVVVVFFLANPPCFLHKQLFYQSAGKYIQHRMFRESCLAVEGNFLKDLTVLGRDLSKTVLVDNSPHAFGYQVDNGIPIESWFDCRSDTELLKLESFCRELHEVSDVRDVIRNKFMTFKRVRES